MVLISDGTITGLILMEVALAVALVVLVALLIGLYLERHTF